MAARKKYVVALPMQFTRKQSDGRTNEQSLKEEGQGQLPSLKNALTSNPRTTQVTSIIFICAPGTACQSAKTRTQCSRHFQVQYKCSNLVEKT